jgi:hypothetical protein
LFNQGIIERKRVARCPLRAILLGDLFH